jgi:NADH dehydrogenase
MEYRKASDVDETLVNPAIWSKINGTRGMIPFIYYEADIDAIDLEKKEIVISHALGRQSNPIGRRSYILKFDFLVIALGNETNFFDKEDVTKNSLTIKTLGDAIVLRNHVINMLEQADIEHEDADLRKSLLTFVVVGGGFSGVETVGELNDFMRESIKLFYHNINEADARIFLISSGQRILPEVTEDLSEFALQKIRKSGVEVLLNTRVQDVLNYVKLSHRMLVVEILFRSVLYTPAYSLSHNPP